MGADSTIPWTDHTFNSWIGCSHVSPGCENCYAETLANRWRWAKWGSSRGSTRRFVSASTWAEPLKWNRKAIAAGGPAPRVFCASLADVFEDRPELVAPRAQLFRLIADTPALRWLILTKRVHDIRHKINAALGAARFPRNVVIGFSAEDFERFSDRTRRLDIELSDPDGIHCDRFLSVEPMLGPIDRPWLRSFAFVICGGESGSRARPMALEWVRSLRRECAEQDVPFFFKQTGCVLARELGLRDRAGADPSEWPSVLADVFVRELPASWTEPPA